MYKIEVRKSAYKDLKKIPQENIKNILDRIHHLEKFPDIQNIKKLTNFHPEYRLRIGKYRVLFDIEDDTIFVGRILHRQKSYK